MVEIIENRAQWEEHFNTVFKPNFVAHYDETGEMVYRQDHYHYDYVKHESSPAGKAVDLSKSKLALITSAGTYLKAAQEPFDAPNPLGDYTMRTYPFATDFSDLAVAHDHYDHVHIDQDRQVLVPLRHLEAMVEAGEIGSLVPEVISYSGYQPDVTQIVDVLAPQILEKVQAMAANAALLVPS